MGRPAATVESSRQPSDAPRSILLPVPVLMQRRSPLFWSLLVLLALAAGLRWWLREQEPLPPPNAPGPAAGVPAAGADPQPAAAVGEPSPGIVVAVRVSQRERYVPPARAGIEVLGADGKALNARLIAGVGAGAHGASDGDGGGLALTLIDGIDGRLLRQVRVGRDEAKTALGERMLQRGRVVDPVERPLVGAEVWLGEWHGDGSRRTATTDEDGRFALDTPGGAGVPLVVRLPGRATVARFVGVAVPLPTVEIVLQPAGRLVVQLAARAVAIESARVFVSPRVQSTELSSWPFFLQSVDGGYAVDADGRVAVDDLPQVGELDVYVRHPLALAAGPVPVALRGAHSHLLAPLEHAPGRVAAQVVGADGQPLVGVEVVARRGSAALRSANPLRFLPPLVETTGVFWTRTDEQGRFTIGVHGDERQGGDWTVALRAAGRAGRDLPLADVHERTIVLPAMQCEEASFVLLPPVAGAAWRADVDLAGGIRSVRAADAPFHVALPAIGAYDFVVTTTVGERRAEVRFADVAVTGPVELRAPAPD
jgi:hypothetical protein